MPRNFFHRIEIATPIQDRALQERIVNQILTLQLADTAKAWMLSADGTYERVKVPGNGAAVNTKNQFLKLAEGTPESKPRKKIRRATRRWPVVQVETQPR